MRISPEEYPLHQEWDDKVFTMPNLPRGDAGFVEVLRQILTMVQERAPKDTALTFSGSTSAISLEEACIRLRPMKLVAKDASGWTLPATSAKWLESGDDLYLAAILCANVRFLAEILFYLDVPRTATELQEIAVSEYDMSWKTKSPLNNRLVWLREFGFIDFQQFSVQYSLTERGKEFLQTVKVVGPSEVARDFDDTMAEPPVSISDWAKAYEERSKAMAKKSGLGYFPGSMAEIGQTLSAFLSLIRSGAEYGTIMEYAIKHYDIAPSSVKSFMSSLVSMNYVVRKTDTVFEVTELAQNWLQNESAIDLVVCLNGSHLFVLDLLNELKTEPMSYKELSAKAKVSYGFGKEDTGEIRKRIAIFKSAKLVFHSSAEKYTLTHRGYAFLNLFPDLPVVVAAQPKAAVVKTGEDLSALFHELRLSSRDSSNPARFERAVQRAFQEMGFDAQLLGGSGKTDVLLKAPGAPKYSFTVAVDAKCTASGSVNDGLVDFDTLKEHKKKHKAEYVAMVGCAFQNERLIKRAVEHHVVLLDVDALETLIKKHKRIPLLVTSYRAIFEQDGIADIAALEKERKTIERSGILMHAVMDCLLMESKDNVIKGLLQERDIYRSLRNHEAFADGIHLEEISAMLTFLSSPLVGCLGKEKDYFYAIGSPEDAAGRFDFFARACKETTAE